MKDASKIYVIGSAVYANWLDFDSVDNIEDADLVMFTGGADVFPELYGDFTHRSTYFDAIRDVKEMKLFERAKELNIPMIGICRGSQFLTAMQQNGKLIQDCDNHGINGTHKITTDNGGVLDISSTHHQMMYPYNMDDEDYELIAWSSINRSNYYAFGDVEFKDEEMEFDFKEPEIVYYPNDNALAIQGHPEYLGYDHSTCEYLRNLVNSKLFKHAEA